VSSMPGGVGDGTDPPRSPLTLENLTMHSHPTDPQLDPASGTEAVSANAGHGRLTVAVACVAVVAIASAACQTLLRFFHRHEGEDEDAS